MDDNCTKQSYAMTKITPYPYPCGAAAGAGAYGGNGFCRVYQILDIE